MLSMPVSRRTRAIFARCSDAWVWTSNPCAAEAAAVASSRSRVHDSANRGASAARSRPPAAPCQRRWSASDLVDAGSGGLKQPARHASPLFIRHLPIVARRCVDVSASNTASVSWTVSIVNAVVVPPSRSSAAASRAEAARVAASCAASIGQIAIAQPREQRQIVGSSRETASDRDGCASG
jgi:hypothetical protein